MSNLTPALALRAAINVLRDSAESRRMPNGEPLTDTVVQLHLDAADMLEESLSEDETMATASFSSFVVTKVG